jgi:hypothetical protein
VRRFSIVSSEIRAAIKLQESLKTVLNYKRMERFLSIKVILFFNKKGQLTHYIAFESSSIKNLPIEKGF